MEFKKKIRSSSQTNGLLLIIFMLLVMVGVQLLIAPVTAIFAAEGDKNYESVFSLTAFIMQYFVGVGLPLLVFSGTARGKELSKKQPLFVKPAVSWGMVVKYIFIAFAFIYSVTLVFNFIMNMIQRVLGVEFTAIDFSAEDNAFSRIVNVIAMMFLAPFFEELLFRGTFVRNSSRYGTWHVVIATGIIFGLWHMNYEQTFATAAFGMATAFIYIKTRSIIPSMIMHFCFNTLGTIQSFYVDADMKEKIQSKDVMTIMMEEPAKYIIMSLMGMLIIALIITGIVLFATEWQKNRESFMLEKAPEDSGELTEKQKFGVYFSAPATVFICAVLLLFTVLRGAGVM